MYQRLMKEIPRGLSPCYHTYTVTMGLVFVVLGFLNATGNPSDWLPGWENVSEDTVHYHRSVLLARYAMMAATMFYLFLMGERICDYLCARMLPVWYTYLVGSLGWWIASHIYSLSIPVPLVAIEMLCFGVSAMWLAPHVLEFIYVHSHSSTPSVRCRA
jgi:hypothetical protein